jgi:predicted HTH domain antitoxin
MPLSQENQIQIAISAIQNKKVCLNRRAASIFKVPKPTLRAHLKGRKLRSETRTNSHKLTELEEEVLAKRLLDADK